MSVADKKGKQRPLEEAASGASLPAGASTEAKQDVIASLVEAVQELNARLMVIAGMANSGIPALRVVQTIAPPTTPVSGTVTATVASTVVSSLTNFGTGIPASEMAHDINNYTAVIANINNVTP